MTDIRALFDSAADSLNASDMERALEAARRALAVAGTPAEHAGAQYWMAKCRYVAGELDVAVVLAAEACTAAADANEPVWLARSRTLQARCLEGAGEPQSALDLAQVAVQDLEALKSDNESLAEARQAAAIALGVIYLSMGDLPLTLEWCQSGAELARALPQQTAYGAAVDTVACVYAAMAAHSRSLGQHEQAELHERKAIACSTEAVQVARHHGHIDYEASALCNLAESLTLVGDTEQALALLLDWSQRHPARLPWQESHHQDSLGQVHLALGRADEAVQAFTAALALSESLIHRAVITEHLSGALECCGRWQEALARYKEFHAIQAQVSAERAQRNARVAALHLNVERERARGRMLASSNDQLRRRAEDLQRLSVEDPLTGLANRRHIDALLSGPLDDTWVAIVDADHFKRINDIFSHAVGDAVLVRLADILRANCRPTDTAGRLGGEEFLVLYRAGPQSDVGAAAERLRECVAGFDWGVLAPGLTMTVSIGLAGAGEATDATALLALADRRLYAAKHAGRNRVVALG